jgi:prepilin-type N-terminal cleavage/methylation domain-containing protein
MKNLYKRKSKGFSIIELIVVIVVIGILAAITYVFYTNVQSRAVDASVQSDINNMNSSQLQYGLDTGGSALAYYSGNGRSATLGFTPNGGNIIDVVTNGKDYCIRGYNTKGTKNSINNPITKESSPGVCGQLGPSVVARGLLACPSGFITVPGSSTYSTSDFCVMKYEAKNAGGNIPVSQASGSPWGSISQTNAISYSQNVAGCSGCHLITENEWMTIAQNVLSVPSNWSGGLVGSGYIYSGHNDYTPGITLAADSNDANGYAGETNTGGNQLRTLTLSTGQVIWDFAGNIWEWTSGTSTTNQPGKTGDSVYTWNEWPAVNITGALSTNVFPSGTGITGASSWNSSNGIGQIYSKASEVGLRGFIRGGSFTGGNSGGILTLSFDLAPSGSATNVGFRVSSLAQ